MPAIFTGRFTDLMSPRKRRIAVIPTGGTIQLLGLNRLDLAHYGDELRPVTASQLLDRVPELTEFADPELVDFGWYRGLGPEEWLKLARLLERLLAQDRIDGAVVGHGTNTLEETAYFLNLTVSRKPIVVTGSMRPPSGASSDCDLNLIRAVQTASSPSAAGLGVLIVLNDTIHAAREVTKANTYRAHAFESRDSGPLGFADADGKVVITHKPARRHTWGTTFSLDDISGLPRVDVAVSYAGQDGTTIDACVSAGASGIILAGSGAGGRNEGEDAAIDRALARRVAVVLSSRTGSGRVVASPAETSRGLIGADSLGPWKSRVLLMLALTRARSRRWIQSVFEQY